MSKKHRGELLEATRGAASALVEDLEHVRHVMALPETSRGELRRLSVVARRLLVNEELSAIAAPRIGKLTLDMPDLSAVYDLVKRGVSVLHFAGGAQNVFGQAFGLLQLNLRKPLPGETVEDAFRRLTGREIGDFGQDFAVLKPRVSVRLHNFLNQRVLCVGDLWASRGDAIKYVANVLGGAHSGEPKTEAERTCAHMQRTASYRLDADGRVQVHVRKDLGENGVAMWLDNDADAVGESPLKGKDLPPVDPVLIEVLAALRYMADSADVIRLEALVRQEIDAAAA